MKRLVLSVICIYAVLALASCVKEYEPISNSTVQQPAEENDPPEEVSTEPKEFSMPIVTITHKQDRVHSSYYIDAEIDITDPDKHWSDVEDLRSTMQIKGHGNSTWSMPKQPYRIKLTEEQKVLGMPKNRDWVLLANYSDKSLLRNAVAMKTSSFTSMLWTPRFRKVEVYLNGTYMGVYDLFEAKEVTKNKVDIDLEAGDVYMEIESATDEPCYFKTSKCNVPIQFKEPENPSTTEQTKIKNLLANFETALYSSYFDNADKGYAKYIDVESFIDNYIIEELAKDIDGNTRKSSFFIVKQDGNKIQFCNQWDFDLCYGNADYFPSGLTGADGDNNGPKGWWIKDYNSDSWKGPGWYNRLFQDPAFVKKVKQRWAKLYPSLQTMPDYIDGQVIEMGPAVTRNFKKWDILNTYVWPNVKVTGSYEGEISYLKDFYTKRLAWLNENINSL